MREEFAKLTVRFITRESAKKVLNPIFKKLIEGQYKDIEFELDVTLE